MTKFYLVVALAACVGPFLVSADGEGAVAVAEDAFEWYDVQNVTSTEELEGIVTDTHAVMVMFWEPWCTHSQGLLPIWRDLAMKQHDKLGSDGKTQKVLLADCSHDDLLCKSNYDVESLPHVKLFVDGTPLPKFKGSRAAEGRLRIMESYLASRGADEPEDVNTLTVTANLEAEIAANDVLFVLFYSKYCMHCDRMMNAWLRMAAAQSGRKSVNGKRVRILRADCISPDFSCTSFEVNAFPTMHLFLGGIKQPPYKGARDKMSLTSYLISEGDAVNSKYAQRVNGAEAAEIIRMNLATLLYFPKPDCETPECERVEQIIENTAESINEKQDFRIARLDCRREDTKAACEEYAVTEEMLPDTIIFGRATRFTGVRIPATMSKPQFTVELAKATFPPGAAISQSLKNQERDFAESKARPPPPPPPPPPPAPTIERTGDDAKDFFAAAAAGDVATVLELVDSGVELDQADESDDGRSALHKAASSDAERSAQVAEELLAVGANPEVQDGNGETPLMTAAGSGSAAKALLLVDNGADVNAKDKQGWTALHFAVYKNHKDVVKLLVDSGADGSAEDGDGISSLKLAEEQAQLTSDGSVVALLQPAAGHQEL